MSKLPPSALPHIAQLRAYAPGLQPVEPGWLKLNTNESPYAPSPRVAEAIRHEMGVAGDSLRLYPDPKSSALRRFIGRMHDLDETNVLVGNGSDDALNLLMRVFSNPAHPTGFTVPSYSLYPVLIAIQNGALRAVEFTRDMKLPLEAIAALDAQAFFLTSPNAPTGVGFAPADIEAVLAAFKGLLVVDEAYAPFARQNAVALLKQHPRLVITRTLSKAHALAGLRIGYALGDPGVIDLLDRVRDSYNVNRLSQVAALAALSDQGYYDAIIGKVVRTRDFWIAEWAGRRGWFTYPSEANFIFTEPRTAAGKAGPEVAGSLYEFLLSRRILVRIFPSHALTAPFLRISVGTDDDMLAVNEAFDAWLKNVK